MYSEDYNQGSKEAHSDIDIEPYMRTSQVAGSLTITI